MKNEFSNAFIKVNANELTTFIQRLSTLKFNINIKVYTGGILSFGNNIVQRPISTNEPCLR